MNKLRRSAKRIVLLTWSIALLCISCKKEEIKGPQGDPGSPGGGGNSNISSTSVFVINSSQWKADSVSQSLKASVNSALLTKDVVEKGAVKVYIQTGTSWSELPYDSGDLFMQYSFQEGALSLYYINIEGGFATAPATANYRMTTLSESARPGKLVQSDGNGEHIKKTNLIQNSDTK